MKTTTLEDIRNIFKCIAANPGFGSRKIQRATGIGHSTIDKYRQIAAQHQLAASDIPSLADDMIAELFGLCSRKIVFLEPDWEDVRKYVSTPHEWGGKLNSLADAWLHKYLERLFPDYIAGELPPNCMSQRTFERRYNEFLKENGLECCTHSPVPSLNFGPASMVEVDTIGDKLIFHDRQGQKHEVLVFCGILKFSGYFYVEAIPQNTGLCWNSAIVNMLWSFGGKPQVLRTDNDSAICIHGKKAAKTKNKPTPSFLFLIRELEMTLDLCPIFSPRWKGAVERQNGLDQQKLFADPKLSEPLIADSIDELNAILAGAATRMNAAPRAGNQLSRTAVFKTYEEPFLLPLPFHRPRIRRLTTGRIRLNGYVAYQKNFYYAGKLLAGKELLIENLMGKSIRLMDQVTYDEIAVYELDNNRLPPGHYHKAEQFKSEAEKIISRDRTWFENYFSALKNEHSGIDSAVTQIWEKHSQAPAVATRLCNLICNLYEAHPDTLPELNEACAMAAKRGLMGDFKTYLQHAYEILCQGDYGHRESQPTADGSTNDINDRFRGGDYYEQLCN